VGASIGTTPDKLLSGQKKWHTAAEFNSSVPTDFLPSSKPANRHGHLRRAVWPRK